MTSTPTPQDLAARDRVRALRRARRYLADGEGDLARVLTAYRAMSARDPSKRFLPEQ